MEGLATLMLCHSDAMFMMSMYRVYTMEFNPVIVYRNGFELLWTLTRCIFDVYMSISFLVSVAQNKINFKTFTKWLQYALWTVLVDACFVILLIEYEPHIVLGLELIGLITDAVMKLVFVCLLLKLRQNTGLVQVARLESVETKPLLSYNYSTIW